MMMMMMMIYIYYDEVSVCLCAYNEKSSLSPSELSAGGAKRDARQALPAVGRLWPSDDDGHDDGNDNDITNNENNDNDNGNDGRCIRG